MPEALKDSTKYRETWILNPSGGKEGMVITLSTPALCKFFARMPTLDFPKARAIPKEEKKVDSPEGRVSPSK
jgi:hypothetical protein